MRQYAILYRRATMKDFKRLEPNVDANLYDRPQVAEAVEYMRANAHVQGVAMIVEDEAFNVMAFDQEAEAPRAFRF